MNGQENIYSRHFVESLFDRMASSYSTVNLVSSFGFNQSWRKKCVAGLRHTPGVPTVYDLMSGMGELWPIIWKQLDQKAMIVGVDFSHEMINRADPDGRATDRVRIIQGDALEDNTLPHESADHVTCCFGLKTLSESQLVTFARRVEGLLKPGGSFSFIEISDPKDWTLRWFYLFYLKRVIPFIGRLLLGDPDCYRMLGIYAEEFGDTRAFVQALRQAGLQAEFRKHFFGCATSAIGYKP